MKEKNKRKVTDIIEDIVLVVGMIACIYVYFIYNRATSEVIQPLQNDSDYEIYTGKKVYEYYRESKIPKSQIPIYDQMKEGYLQFEKTFSINKKMFPEGVSEDELDDICDAVLLDHVELFWMDRYKYLKKNDMIDIDKKIYFKYSYEREEAKEIRKQLEKTYNPIIEEAEKLNTDYEKVKFVHDKLIEIGAYKKYDENLKREFQSCVSIFKNGDTVCSGFAYSFKFIMDRLGINSIAIRHIEGEKNPLNHIWNMVEIDNNWYNLDITYDDELEEKGKNKYTYFLKGDEKFYKTHKKQEGFPIAERDYRG